MTDPPDHARYRKILDPLLSPKVVAALEDSLRAQAAALIDDFVGSGECDVVKDLAELFPTQVLLTLFGLPVEDRDKFRSWGETVLSQAHDVASDVQKEAGLAMFAYLQDNLERKRGRLGNDMLSRILAITGEDRWSDTELLGLCFTFVLAAIDTTSGAIGFLFYYLARQPDLRRKVIDDRATVVPLVEEVLRIEAPVPYMPRRTTQEVDVCGVRIPADAYCIVMMGCANRDIGGDFPDEIDLDRAGRTHLSFGGGIHRCLGSHLARRNLRLVVEEFHRRIPDYWIKPGFTPRIAWPRATFHLETLPVQFQPRSP
ncbi:cytochrome P450 [Mycobacterium sp. SP-6446]|uniref:cytochrome P450 n=1 Tax=Mycobacterium sp. SP-6446 TaxID=1834162 RepID=UPI00158B1B5E|nr:cytochrome P450 [Mycobacterium sp. SP-6446]